METASPVGGLGAVVVQPRPHRRSDGRIPLFPGQRMARGGREHGTAGGKKLPPIKNQILGNGNVGPGAWNETLPFPREFHKSHFVL